MKLDVKIKQKCKNIRLLIVDVDGVLTDGGRYYSKNGEELKKFHTRDGMGINNLLRQKIKTVILTKDKSSITRKWAKEMNIDHVYEGFKEKEQALEDICKKYRIELKNIAFIGDDINDIEVLKIVGFSVVPNDAAFQTKKIAHYVCKTGGGKGCVRELTDLILLVKFPTKTKWY
jgi:YrbI family 3-deoxy-D-manno-octulosonate 8-phosphate phosphatase